VNAGEFLDYADMTRALGFTRARVTQMMDLLLLAPDIQEETLYLSVPAGTAGSARHHLRRVAAITS
jgi:hypothetical protein